MSRASRMRPRADMRGEDIREARLIQKALSRPSKETAKKQVHTVMAGQKPEERKPRRSKQINDGGVLAGPTARTVAPTELALDKATPSERAYSEELFDPARLRKHW